MRRDNEGWGDRCRRDDGGAGIGTQRGAGDDRRGVEAYREGESGNGQRHDRNRHFDPARPTPALDLVGILQKDPATARGSRSAGWRKTETGMLATVRKTPRR